MGLPLVPDMFSTGKSAHGYGHVVRAIYQGSRTLSADYFTNSTEQAGISTKTNTYIDRVSLEIDSAGAIRANGVFLQDTNDQKTFVKACKEVIISAGTYGSPGILLRSGIGAEEEVEKLGIKSQVNLPGVGKNLMDHLVSSPPRFIHKTEARLVVIRPKMPSFFYHIIFALYLMNIILGSAFIL